MKKENKECLENKYNGWEYRIERSSGGSDNPNSLNYDPFTAFDLTAKKEGLEFKMEIFVPNEPAVEKFPGKMKDFVYETLSSLEARLKDYLPKPPKGYLVQKVNVRISPDGLIRGNDFPEGEVKPK